MVIYQGVNTPKKINTAERRYPNLGHLHRGYISAGDNINNCMSTARYQV
jgi:hypothetical protein